MSRAQELRQRMYKRNVTGEEETTDIGQKLYDHVCDVVDAVSCNTIIKDSMQVKLKRGILPGADNRYLETTTIPRVKGEMKTRAGKVVETFSRNMEFHKSEAYDEMKKCFEGEEGYDVAIDGAVATVTVTIPKAEG